MMDAVLRHRIMLKDSGIRLRSSRLLGDVLQFVAHERKGFVALQRNFSLLSLAHVTKVNRDRESLVCRTVTSKSLGHVPDKCSEASQKYK